MKNCGECSLCEALNNDDHGRCIIDFEEVWPEDECRWEDKQ